jgi:transcriptional regulator with GAF, ATPase, and Fis domain
MAREGVTVCGAGAPGGVCPALLLFERPDAEVFEFLSEGRRQGAQRILAVCLRREALGNGAVWKLLEAGASDVLAWDDAKQPAAGIAARLRRFAEVDEVLGSPLVTESLVGQSPAWLSVLRQVIEVARFTDASVLLTGESGTGKELAARLIHGLDTREAKGRLVVLDCTTVVPELSGSEFFGHERGAFTHAIAVREGAFGLADGGTLFLDEVGELPLTLQAELLRVVQERSYKRVGSNVWRQASFRLICATNRDLRAMEAQGRFRRDFYFRIAAWTCRLPTLSERQEDILPLARHFLKEIFGPGPVPELDPALGEYLRERQYPGNVRDLRQLVHRMAKRHVGDGPITVGELP